MLGHGDVAAGATMHAMHRPRTLSSLERAVAVALAAVWLAGGAVALYVSWNAASWMALCAVAAMVYGFAWLRVAFRSRLLTWQELVLPWR